MDKDCFRSARKKLAERFPRAEGAQVDSPGQRPGKPIRKHGQGRRSATRTLESPRGLSALALVPIRNPNRWAGLSTLAPLALLTAGDSF